MPLIGDLKPGTWIKQATCFNGHCVGPAKILHKCQDTGEKLYQEVKEPFAGNESHSIPIDQEVELCQSNSTE